MRKRNTLALVGITAFALMLSLDATVAHAQPISLVYSNNLSLGSTGDSVKDLQGILSENGYLSVPVSIPLGYYGGMTRTGLIKYQAALNVPLTGTFDTITRNAFISHYMQKRWMDSSGNLGINMNTGSTIITTPTNNSVNRINTPLSATGYWFNGNWYGTLLDTSIATDSSIKEYWENGNWHPINR